MANKIDNLFSFGRVLPEPFASAKPKRPTTSKYGTGESTLFSSGMKAMLNYMGYNNPTDNGAVGTNGDFIISEYKSSVDDERHLVVYKKSNGSVLASIINTKTSAIIEYKLGRTKGARDGAAILFTLMPMFLEDEEFKDNYMYLENQLLDTTITPDYEDLANIMGVLCDNIYRRLKDPNCAAHIQVNLPESIGRISSTAIIQQTYSPNTVLCGVFKVFTPDTTVKTKQPVSSIKNDDFKGKYTLNKTRVLSEMEKEMVPDIPDYIIISNEAQKICKLAEGTTGKPTQQRNFLLRGGAGSGKSMTAKTVAAGLGLPYVYMTCHPDTTMDELSGVMLPITDDDDLSCCSEGELKVLNDMGGATAENIAKLLNLPDLDTMEYDPEIAYEKMTGTQKDGVTQQECFAIYTSAIAKKAAEIEKAKNEEKADGNSGTKYRYVESTLLKAIKYGWVVEIQEPTVITRPGVLAGLNGIMEQDGKIVLADGKVINRHPDAVVICTTNSNYQGCRGLNESVIDRMNQLFDVETPSVDEMVERTMKITGETDEEMVRKFATVVNDVADYCKKNDITGGVTGMRVLIDWVTTNQVLNDEYESALHTVIAKATDIEEERAALKTTCLDIVIAPLGF